MNDDYYYLKLVRKGDIEAIRKLFKDDHAGMCQLNPYDQSLVFLAIIEDQTSILKLLIEQGCDVNRGDKERGSSPLQVAAKKNNLAALEILIASGAEIDQTDKYGNTPLLDAVHEFQGDLSIIQRLLDAGANPLHANNYGVTANSLASTVGKSEVVTLFARGTPSWNPSSRSD